MIPQILQKLRKNDPSLTKIVLRNEPIAKTTISIGKKKNFFFFVFFTAFFYYSGEALKTNTHLTSLALYKTKINDDGAKALAEAIKVNTTLTHLTLVETELTGEGMYDLMKAIRENNTLTHLKINNGI